MVLLELPTITSHGPWSHLSKKFFTQTPSELYVYAHCAVSTPTCGPCLGGYMGILAAGERAIATTNRNFRGRMGSLEAEVYLASPCTAAASAVTGVITSPEKL